MMKGVAKVFNLLLICLLGNVLLVKRAAGVEIENSRRLFDTADVINNILLGQIFEFGGSNVQEIVVGDLNFDIDEDFEVFNGFERRRFRILATDVAARLSLDVPVVPNIVVRSSTSRFGVSFDMLSNLDGRQVPFLFGRTSPAVFDCDDMVNIQVELGGLANTAANAVEGSICDLLTENLKTQFVPLLRDLNDQVVDLIGGERLLITETVPELIAAAEGPLLSTLPQGMEILDFEEISGIFDHLLEQFLTSTLVVGFIAELEVFKDALVADDSVAALNSLNNMFFFLDGEVGDLPADTLDFLFGGGFSLAAVIGNILESLFTGELEIIDLVSISLSLVGIDIPSVEEAQIFLSSLPKGIITLLEILDLDDLFLQIINGLDSDQNPFTRRRLQVSEGVLGQIDFPVSAAVALLPVGSPLASILLSFGEDTQVLDVVVEIFENFLALASEVDSGLFYDVTDPLSDPLFQMIFLSSFFIPEVAEIIPLIEQSNNTLELVTEERLTFTTQLDIIGNVTLRPFRFNFLFSLEWFDENFGQTGNSSFVFPGLNISEISLELGFDLSFVNEFGTQTFADTLIFDMSIPIVTQEAITLGLRYQDFLSFGFDNLNSLTSILEIGSDFSDCAFANVAGSLSAQRTDMDFNAFFSTLQGFLQGAIADGTNAFLEHFRFAPSTFVENLLLNFTAEPAFFDFGGDRAACFRQPLVGTQVGGGGLPPPLPGDDPDDDGDEDETASSLDPILLGGVGAGVMAISVLGVIFLVRRSRRKNNNRKSVKLMTEEEKANKEIDSIVAPPDAGPEVTETEEIEALF